MKSILQNIPTNLSKEVFETLLENNSIKIKRIISKGHTSPESGWYDQEQHEWVLLMEGAACISFEEGQETKLGKGDYLNIPARVKHKVSWTDPSCKTIWLAIFYGGQQT